MKVRGCKPLPGVQSEATTDFIDLTPYTKLVRNDFNGTGNTNLALGQNKRDDDGVAGTQTTGQCITMQGTRRIGTCEDGQYTLNMRMIDSSGNIGDWVGSKVERDSVSPVTPSVSVNADNNNRSIYLSVSGEADSTARITGSTYQVGFLPDSGYTNKQVVYPSSYTYLTTYTWTISLSDRAGNLSAPVTVSYTTPPPLHPLTFIHYPTNTTDTLLFL